MAKLKKHGTRFPGVRYYESEKRVSYRGRPDRYYSIRYRVDGKLKEEGLGWASEGWNPEKANQERAKLTAARAVGDGPRTLAGKKELQRKQEAAAEAKEIQRRRDQRTFTEVWARYCSDAQQNKSTRSVKREDSLYRLWVSPVIGKMTLPNIRPLNLEKIKRDMLKAGRSAASIRYALAVVRQVFNFAIKNNLFDGTNPTSKVDFPRQDNRRMRFLSQEEGDALLAALEKLDVRVYQMALLSLDCGLRRGEIFNLAWGDVDLRHGTVLLRDTKNRRNRVIYMTSRVSKMLAGLEAAGPSVPVFPGSDNTLTKAISRKFLSAIGELGLNDGVEDPRHRVVFHTLRHTYASRLAENGISLYTIKELMGHCTLAMTERYAHLNNAALQKTATLLDQINEAAI